MKFNFNIFKKKKQDDFYQLPKPNGSIEYFNEIKDQSEKYWNESKIDPDVYGFQIQNGTKWNKGLSENELSEFQNELKIVFPEELKNFYRTMNGLDKDGINIFGSNGNESSYSPIYYSYPKDIKYIKERIEWIYESNGLNYEKVESQNIPKIFPVTGHRFLIVDNNCQVLSMYGDDIIFWSDNVSKLVADDIFTNIKNVSEFESNPNFAKPIKFWLAE